MKPMRWGKGLKPRPSIETSKQSRIVLAGIKSKPVTLPRFSFDLPDNEPEYPSQEND